MDGNFTRAPIGMGRSTVPAEKLEQWPYVIRACGFSWTWKNMNLHDARKVKLSAASACGVSKGITTTELAGTSAAGTEKAICIANCSPSSSEWPATIDAACSRARTSAPVANGYVGITTPPDSTEEAVADIDKMR